MTQVLEPVHVAMMEDVIGSSPDCKKKPATASWKARISKVGTNDSCDPDRLYQHMSAQADAVNEQPGPDAFVAKKKMSTWRLADCDEGQFPMQAHHLIPKNHLPKHDVCAFLAKKAKHGLPFKLKNDAPYSNDHENNGYCLPYASALSEWQGASADKKSQTAFVLMGLTGRQLHQGSHREHQYTPETDAAEEDDDDPGSDHSQSPGYLAAVDELLDLVLMHEFSHVMVCSVCKADDDKPDILPRKAVARHMDQASLILKVLMDAQRIFVSKRAYLYANLTQLERAKIAKKIKEIKE
jgi:hypothetical protein